MRWAFASLIVLIVAGCMAAPRPAATSARDRQEQEILLLVGDIRHDRQEMNLPPEPARRFLVSKREHPFRWPGHPLSDKCQDVCGTAQYICDAKDKICRIAEELGADDAWAQEQCANARASCREAQETCDSCQ